MSPRRVCAILALLLAVPSAAAAQEEPAPADEIAPESGDGGRTQFASFDVGFGVTVLQDASVGISYGAAVDVANLLIRGTAIRFGFRFWTADDELPDGRLVDLDDSILSLMVKKNVQLGRLDAYGGIGGAGHFVAARFHEFLEQTEKRNGFRFGLEGILGLELPVVDDGFVSLFAEGQGSLVKDISQVSLHGGVRIRFDRLGGSG